MALKTVIAGAGIMATLAAAGAQSGPLPFVGQWDCEVATFTFTAKTYNNGSETLAIRKIEHEGANYRLEFDKGYAISLRITAPGRMNWYSFASGDRFSCRKQR